MVLELADFPEYFRQLNAGDSPFQWQVRLAESLVSRGTWPDVIDAPTGSGKSSVVDIHAFALALSARGQAPRLPRRMSVVVNRRTMVDKHLDRALIIRERLETSTSGLLREVADALRDLSGTDTTLICESIRGGHHLAARKRWRSWIDEPCAAAVIAATPDMWGSRILFRGYGTSRFARPREAGLLAIDSVLILDEAHLNQQLLSTARDLSDLVSAESSRLGVPGLQVVETTATPTSLRSELHRVGVDEPDLSDGKLATRLHAAKTGTVLHARSEQSSKAYVEDLADMATDLAREVEDVQGGASTVLCVVNRVDTAHRLAARLTMGRDPDEVVCWVGRMRPMDLDQLRDDRPGLLTPDGDPRTRFLVATQTVEVGVDIDCAALLTELAPASALVQRFGRVNRRGLRQHAPIRVVVPPSGLRDLPPYTADELKGAMDWLGSLGPDADMSPWALRQSSPPAAPLARAHLSRFHAEHTEFLARTTDDPFEDMDLTFWIRDSLEQDLDPVGIVIRDLTGVFGDTDNAQVSVGRPEATSTTTDSAYALLTLTPPDAREILSVPTRSAKRVLDEVAGRTGFRQLFRWSGDFLEAIDLHETPIESLRIRAGDVFVIDLKDAARAQDLLLGLGSDRPLTAWGPVGVQVYSPQHESDELSEDTEDWCTFFADASPEDAEEMYFRRTGMNAQILLPPAGIEQRADTLQWVVLKPVDVVAADPELRQEWTPSALPVLLDAHQAAVGERAERWGRAVGLPDRVVSALNRAGMLHDEGKLDIRFQRQVLGTGPDNPPLAKSTTRSSQQIQRQRGESELPLRWRHEQLSAAYAFSRVDASADRDLVARLVGTSHGRGRPFFPHGAQTLGIDRHPSDVASAALHLFQTGAGWSGVLDRSEREWGPYGCAYLEALLRGADCQVSEEGS